MSLGILKVGAALERAGVRCEMLDLSGIENYLDALDAHLATTEARAVAITTTTPQLPAAAQIAARIRARRPDLRLIVGGPHATLVHSAYKREAKAVKYGRAFKALTRLLDLFDVVVSGDGEEAIFDALARPLCSGKRSDCPAPLGDGVKCPLSGVPERAADDLPTMCVLHAEQWTSRVIDADEPKGGLFMSDADYEESPWPARHLVDVASYRYSIDGMRACSTILQLGCPFGCGFCGGRNSKMLRQIRTRSTANAVAEIEYLHREYGFTGFMLYDDELNVNREMVPLMNAIADLQAGLGVEFRLRGFVKSELFTDEQAAAMRRAGFRWVLCGFEAAASRILDNINKRATREDNTRVVEIARRHGLKVKALMSVGHPGESEETILAVRDWLLEVKPDDFDVTAITVYPGTPYFDDAVETAPGVWTYTAKRTGDVLHAADVDYTTTADYYKGDPDSGYVSHVYTEHLSAAEIVRLRDVVERDVREKLQIPFNPAQAAQRYEHSMGQGLPPFILRRSAP